MDVDTRSALLSVSRAGLNGAPHDALVHGALVQLQVATSCEVAVFYAASEGDGALTTSELLPGERSVEALPALHPHIMRAADTADAQPCEIRTDDHAATRWHVAAAVRSGGKTYGVLAAAFAGMRAATAHRAFLCELADVLALSLRADRRRVAAETLFERSRYVFDHNPNAMMVLDAVTMRFIDVNQTAIDAYGYSRAQWLAMTPDDLRPAERTGDVHAKTDVLAANGPTAVDTVHRRADGSRLDVHLTSIAVERDGGRVRMITVQDVTARNDALARAQQNEACLAYDVRHDRLTGLPNRALLNDSLTAALTRAREGAGMVAVLLLDVDGFKNVNDTMGHSAGDVLLKALAERLRANARHVDCIARMGGDEFIAVLGDVASADGAAEIARHLARVTAEPIRFGDDEIVVTCSIGIALFPADGTDADTLIRNADAAMYQAKRDGRAQCCFFAPAMHHAAEQRLRLDGRLRNALQTGGFRLDYQPIYALDGALFASEALLRWPQPDGRELQPGEFVPYAEESALIVAIGSWVLRTACFRNAAWNRVAPRLRVAVNVSAKQLANPDFVGTVREALGDSGMRPELLELELTETAVCANVERTAAIVRELRELGVRFAVDDFGTGYNSLTTLRSFAVDTLKLDMSFVADIVTSPVDQAIAAAVIGAAHRLGATVTAEGVETPEQRATLAGLGCDAAQGYLFGRPMSAKSFRELLRPPPHTSGDEFVMAPGGTLPRRRLATSAS
jgi:diguanylate cyclase (GGDEF)-like protein/PAS domain S-box-containing protein